MSRDQMLSFRVTREEFVELQRAAAKAGLSVSDIIRLRVFRRRVNGWAPRRSTGKPTRSASD